MDLRDAIDRVLPRRDRLIAELGACVTISDARWKADPQTVVHIDRLLPSLAPPPSAVENDEDAHPEARWRVLTAKSRLYGFSAPSDALEQFHRAVAGKGRRLLVRDLDAGQVAAMLAWHFEEGPIEPVGQKRSRGKRLRPHLITSMAVRDNVTRAMRGEYMVMLWYLLLVVAAIDRKTVMRRRVGVLAVAAIDRKTVMRRRVGVLADSAIALTSAELHALGLRRGPSREHGGHASRDYYELST